MFEAVQKIVLMRSGYWRTGRSVLFFRQHQYPFPGGAV